MINQKRIHGIDALRAVAMLLGVLLHATIAYRVVPEKQWVHDKAFNNWIFDFTYFFIHSFRMPLFFIIAGYFCRLLYKKVGEKEFIKRRWTRVGIPFIGGMLVIVPLGMIPYSIYIYHTIQKLPLETAIYKSVFKLPGTTGVAHLWFLYDLLMFYFITLVLMRLKKNTWFARKAAGFTGWWKARTFTGVYWPFILSIPIWLILIREKSLFVFADTHVIPKHISYIIFYGYFFGLGWLINLRPDIFNILIRKFSFLLLVGLIVTCGLFYVQWTGTDQASTYIWRLVLKVLAAMQVMFLSLGFIGFFLKYFNLESRFWKYVSDASYWVYLVHLGLVIGLQILFMDTSLPGWLRFTLALTIPLIISFATYQLFIRYTLIGTVLHGQRKKIKD